jgi:hypothetical protein
MVIIMVLLMSLSLWAESVKLRHVLSLYVDTKDGGMNLPQGVACRGNVLIVADSASGRLLRFAYQDGVAKGGDEIRVNEVSYPETVQIGTKGEIFVLDGKQRRIARLGPEGAFKGFIKGEGVPGASDFIPMNFRLDGADNFYILDVFSARVLVLDPTGKYVKSADFPQTYGFISDLEVDARGSIFLLDTKRSLVYTLAKDAKEFSEYTRSLRDDINFAMNMTVDSKNFLYIADQNSGGVVIIGPDGSYQGRQLGFGWKEGLLRYPSQLYFNEKEELFIADRENNRIQIYSAIK